jgi:hypothetical protein
MFHRPREAGLFDEPRPNWTFTGNECPGNLDMRVALEQLAMQAALTTTPSAGGSQVR